MSQIWQQFFRRPIVWVNLVLAVLINLGTWSILLTNITPGPDLIVLHYTMYFGVDLLGRWSESLFIPAFGSLLIIVNTLFARYFINRTHVVSYFFLVLTPIYELLLFFAAMFLIVANLPA